MIELVLIILHVIGAFFSPMIEEDNTYGYWDSAAMGNGCGTSYVVFTEDVGFNYKGRISCPWDDNSKNVQ